MRREVRNGSERLHGGPVASHAFRVSWRGMAFDHVAGSCSPSSSEGIHGDSQAELGVTGLVSWFANAVTAMAVTQVRTRRSGQLGFHLAGRKILPPGAASGDRHCVLNYKIH